MTELTTQDIKELVEKLGSAEALAVRCDVRYQTVYKWQKGRKPHKVHVKTMLRLKEELEREGEMKRKRCWRAKCFRICVLSGERCDGFDICREVPREVSKKRGKSK